MRIGINRRTPAMPLDPIVAFAIASGACAMAIGHTLHMSSHEARARELRRSAKRKPVI